MLLVTVFKLKLEIKGDLRELDFAFSLIAVWHIM